VTLDHRDDQGGPPAALVVTDISKTYGPARVLRDVSLRIGKGHVHSLVGGNGSGKSTLVKILAGLVRADPGGTVAIDGQERPASSLTPTIAKASGVHFVHQDPGVFLDMTVIENLSLGRGFETGRAGRIRWRQARARSEEVLARFDIHVDPDLPLGALRPAERTMVAIARALQDQERADHGILVLDEPTASLSASEVTVLLGALRRYAERGQTTLFISHRLDEVLTASDTVSVLRDGCVVATRPAIGLSPRELAELVVGRELAEAPPTGSVTNREAYLELRGFSVGPLEGIDLVAHKGEIVGLAGLLGSGRSRLLHALFGGGRRAGTVLLEGVPIDARTERAAMDAGFALVPEDRGADAAFGDLSVANNLAAADIGRFWRRGHLSARAERTAAEKAVREFNIVCGSVDMKLSTLSGGNQQKVILARWLRRDPKVLLLDEPSQGVDVGARADIHGLIRGAVASGATALVVSSDLEELALLCDRVLVLAGGRIVGEVHGPDIDTTLLTHLTYGPVEAAL
jgi:ribose transport system ATP-binding protein